MRHEVQRIDKTVRALLDRSRPRVIAARSGSLTEVARRAVNLARAQLAGHTSRSHSVTIEFEAPPDPIIIRFDPAQVEDAILNLIINAIEATDGKGHVKVRMAKSQNRLDSQDEIAIEVIDDGHGISEEELTSIFNPFFTTRKGGTGLGLPAVRRIAHAHGGSVEVNSIVGKGSIFSLHLPITQ
jgi:two-component system sensor histidine kinase HydH